MISTPYPVTSSRPSFEEVRGRHAVAGQEPLHVRRGCVAGCAGIDHRDPAPRSSEDERGAQAGCTTTDDHDVVAVLLHGGHAASAVLGDGGVGRRSPNA